MHTRYFDDLKVGDRFKTRGMTLTEGMIVDFAFHYDPQHMHVDKASAESGPFGGLIASGFQTMALAFRLFYELGVVTESNIVGPGVDKLRWLAPVFPGDTIRSEWEVIAATPSRSKPDRGTITWRCTAYNQDGREIMSYEPIMILRKRPTAVV